MKEEQIKDINICNQCYEKNRCWLYNTVIPCNEYEKLREEINNKTLKEYIGEVVL